MFRHFDRYAHLSWSGEGVIHLLRSGDDHNERVVRDFLSRLGDPTLSGTAQALTKVATTYRGADVQAAARVDAALPGVNTAEAAISGYADLPGYRNRPDLFSDAAEPVARLTPPPDYNVELPYEPTWSELASPASVGRQLIWYVTGALAELGIVFDRAWDPYEGVLKPFVGDWAGLATIGYVLAQEAASVRDMQENVWWATQDVDEAWRGNGADAATLHLYRLFTQLERGQSTLDAMSVEYFKAAHGAVELRAVAAFALSAALDAAGGLSFAISGLAASSATGIGAVTAPGWIAAITAFAVRLWNAFVELAEIVHRLEAVAHAFASATEGSLGTVKAFDLPRLPAVPDLV